MIIFFDLDGTLIDSTNPIVTSLKKALNIKGIEASEEKIKSLIGASLEVMFSTLGAKEEQLPEIFKLYKEEYAKCYKSGTSLLNGAKEAIELASKHAKVGLVTTKTRHFAEEILKNFDLLKHFSVVVGGDDVSKCKPNPEAIFKALSLLANSDDLLTKEKLETLFDFKNIYMVGDTLNDTGAAKTAGVKPVVTIFEYTDMSVLQKECDAIFKTPLECVKYIINN